MLKVLRFLRDFTRGFRLRAQFKSLPSAFIFARVSLLNLYITQRNKRGGHRAECPCCGWHGHAFFAMDSVKWWLPDVSCPECGAQERQRMLSLYLDREDKTLENISGTVMHFAAEKHMRDIIGKNPKLRYFSSEYDWEEVSVRCPRGTGVMADIQRLGVGTSSVEVVFCLHVLEHVRDDRAAIAEMHRILKPGGVAYIMVPFDMTLDETVEWEVPDPDIFYHIWAYSLNDFKERLESFTYDEVKPDTFLSSEERVRFGIPPKEVIYRCTKEA